MAVTLAQPRGHPPLHAPMEKLVIEGGVPLSGTILPAGNKNAALPLLACSLLTDEEVVVHNVPRIRDVEAMLALLADIGVKTSWPDDNTVSLQADEVRGTEVNAALAERIYADDGGLRPCDFLMDEPSVMATENALMAAAAIDGTTVIRNAASEPHVQDLARMLNKMGAAIEGIGSNVMQVHGMGKLGRCEHTVNPDHIEIASFMALAGVTGGELRIEGCIPDDMRMIRLVFARLGLRSEFDGDDCVVPGGQNLVVRRDAGDYQSKVEDGPWPAFPADLTSIAVALATQSEGSVLIFEKMFENRLFFVDELITMGAEITICDPHREIVIGPRRLRGQRLSSPDIRAGMAKLIAALCAEGTSEIHNVQQIDRGYERIDERLRELGARIERVAA